MPEINFVEVKKLSLDLKNYRTIPQKNENEAINAIIAINPGHFHAIIKSMIEDDYLINEILVVLKDGTKQIVREGNTRLSALKIIHGLVKADDFELPEDILEKIKGVDKAWKGRNKKIPCTIFPKNQKSVVDKIVSITHGKSESAGRAKWEAMATARHNRDEKGKSEPALDLFEKYLLLGKNINAQQKERWAGNYPLTILTDALGRLRLRWAFDKISDFAAKYPKIKDRDKLDAIMYAIGIGSLSFKIVRDPDKDFAEEFGFPSTKKQDENAKDKGKAGAKSGAGANGTGGKGSGTAKSSQPKTPSTSDPKHVKAVLKKFNPVGKGRDKIVELKNEAVNLKIKETPLAFCYLLRSMFEISAKLYCKDHKLATAITKNGKTHEYTLKELLGEVTKHLTANNTNKVMVKILNGANAEISNPNRILSVTSMNQLVHSEDLSVEQADVCKRFSNIFPLLEAMNK